MMTDEVRKEIDQLRSIIRKIGATLKGLRLRLKQVEAMKTGPRGEIDIESWNRAEHVRERIQGRKARREKVQGRLNDLLRPFKAKKVIPVLREKGSSATSRESRRWTGRSTS